MQMASCVSVLPVSLTWYFFFGCRCSFIGMENLLLVRNVRYYQAVRAVN